VDIEYTLYRVTNTSNEVVFECINDDIYTNVCHEGRQWELKHLITEFIDKNFTVDIIVFTTTELYKWWLQSKMLFKGDDLIMEIS